LLLAIFTWSQAHAVVNWYNHNGSWVKIVYQRPRHQPVPLAIFYEEPSLHMTGLVRPGTLLFRGMIDKYGAVWGDAYIFSSRCGRAPYHVQGEFHGESHDQTLILRGPSPRFDWDCSVFLGLDFNSILIFEFAPAE
jgi:hypothetical protein